MSMPNFPELSQEISCERSLNMILASIAMEELALSHILNAEGEKLKYLIDCFCECGTSADINEILEVNKSVVSILEGVCHNQMILKSKADKAIEALEKVCLQNCCPNDCEKGCAVFGNLSANEEWHMRCGLKWRAEYVYGKCARCVPGDTSRVELTKNGRYLINVNVKLSRKPHT